MVFVTLTSCSTVKFKEIEMDVIQELKGNIKEIRWKTLYFNTKFKDSVRRQEDILVVYDKKYNTLKQIVFHPKGNIEEIYNYNSRGLLENIIAKYTKSISKAEYKYDKKNNIVQYNHYENDTLISSKLTKYDNKNNPIERKLINFKSPKNNWSEKILNDYKSRTSISQGFDEKNIESNSFIKTTYDKKGFIIQSESLNKNNKSKSKSISEYDSYGNLTIFKSYNENGEVKSIRTAKNLYDKKGNIILRETFIDNKLFRRTTLEIVYY